MGAFCCHGNQSFDLICPKTLCSLSPTPVMLHIKFDLGWPAGFRDIQVWKCGRRRRRTDDGPLLYYKLTLWAFSSGELIKEITCNLLPCPRNYALNSSTFFSFCGAGFTAHQDCFTHFEPSQLLMGQKREIPEKKHLTARKQNFLCLTYDPR